MAEATPDNPFMRERPRRRAAKRPEPPRTDEYPLPERVDWAEIAGTPPHRDLALGLWCPKGRATVIYSPAKEGKSEFVLCEIAEALVDGLVVTYLDREMDHEDLRERMIDLGVTPAELINLRYYLYPSLPPLDQPGGGDFVLRLCERDGSSLVVFDTARRFVAGDENENDTWARFWQYTGSVLKREGITWVRVDHSGKDKARGARGASSKNDDVDVVWALARTEGGTLLRLTHSRVSWLPQEISYLRATEPVRYHQALFSLPTGTLEVAALLDRLNLPPTVTFRIAAKAVRDAGHSARNEVISAAVKHRKHHADRAAELDED